MGDDITKGRRDSVAQAGLLDLNEEFGSTTRSSNSRNDRTTQEKKENQDLKKERYPLLLTPKQSTPANPPQTKPLEDLIIGYLQSATTSGTTAPSTHSHLQSHNPIPNCSSVTSSHRRPPQSPPPTIESPIPTLTSPACKIGTHASCIRSPHRPLHSIPHHQRRKHEYQRIVYEKPADCGAGYPTPTRLGDAHWEEQVRGQDLGGPV